ncbi:16S rRNA (cytidine(1402)-2'-O)-methyltransferase [bacterium]|nr:16S rRNA (cytidine(1402)-2'-O)-methyltransferase [bacterium]
MSGQLYLVATPIGNLADITLRALETLKTVDIIACEDTRHTLQLLNKYEIKKPLISYYKHKEQEGSKKIIELLTQGKNIALVSDAGMPCISDPGSVLVQKVLEEGISYTIIPGANAAVCAIALTGVTGGFTFLGFMPEKNKARINLINEYKNVSGNLIFYSAPHDVNEYLEFLNGQLGDRTVYLVKEITKMFETVTKGRLGSLRVDSPKGEYVIVVEGQKESIDITDEEILKKLKDRIDCGEDKKTAIKNLSESLNLPKNKVYEIALKL